MELQDFAREMVKESAAINPLTAIGSKKAKGVMGRIIQLLTGTRASYLKHGKPAKLFSRGKKGKAALKGAKASMAREAGPEASKVLAARLGAGAASGAGAYGGYKAMKGKKKKGK